MPGSPGTQGGTDNQAARAVTYIDLPAGLITMGVNSDDGFLTEAGYYNDVVSLVRIVGGEFNQPGGRGVADSTFGLAVTKPGIYPFVTYWENGGGSSAIVWFTVKSDGTQVAVNDTANGGLAAYRAQVAGPQKAVVIFATPAPGATGVDPSTVIQVQLQDGASPISTNTVSLMINNGAAVPATVSKSGGLTTISYTPSPALGPNTTNSVTLAYTEAGAAVTKSWLFVMANYGVLTPSLAVNPDTTKPGFIWEMSQVASVGNFTQNANQRTIDQLAGRLGPNIADPNVQGVALAKGTPASDPNAPITFEIPTVLAVDRNGAAWGNWGTQAGGDQMPGSPGTDGTTDNQAAGIITYIKLPAGLITMGVNSDDGFRTSAGSLSNPSAIFLGEFEGGRGAADTIFSFVVQQAGVYPFYTIWENGTGDSRIAWFTVKTNGTQVLVNDTANGGFAAYRVALGPATTTQPRLTATLASGGHITISWPTSDGAGFALVATASLTPPVTWQPVTQTPNSSGGTTSVTVPVTSGSEFYQLKK
jgi:hypothetical protein